MKIFSKEQIYEGDRFTIKKQNISSSELMERAGISLFNWLDARLQGAPVPILIFCGIGNNGGDGLVLARHLISHGYNVKTFIVDFSDKRSKDFLINYERLKETTKDWPVSIHSVDDFPEISSQDIIIDAIFGVGLNRPISDWVIALFKHFKASKALTVSVDIPSGLYTDKTPKHEDDVVTSNLILSFQTPKLVFFLPETDKYIDQWEILNIDIDATYLETTETEAEVLGKYDVLPMYKQRDKFSHKGSYGHALIIGGSYGKIGAVQLSSRSALLSGVGLITAFVPKCGYIPLQTALPEAMVITDADKKLITDIVFDIIPDAVGIGIGLGTDEKTVKAFESFLKNNTAPLVIDADGLNILSKNKALLKYLKEDTILTPHPKELKRLIGDWEDDFDKLSKTKAFVKKHKVLVIIKGANSISVYQDKLYINSTGNPGLATGGTGDVLTGIITGLRAQGYTALESACFGTYLHGKSADLAIEFKGYQSLIASDVISYLGQAYLDLFKQADTPLSEKEQKPEEVKK
ncbi:YjeF-like protein [Formosa agariphila KMM 3901]|uniref:Bifunctional NAD(P)H-hydrate repair enzyme n=1 Tax=Formosa agariphila (strain DSM 15362 / KCTC 12365 / LMG 23005 / KMM 3901 / M-2Alg 35-1) TaxID=1347342 RepID=T2KL04_FORAG|nr:bifunctional ADP-dependent NAD(P)H-hydrate dehydratase/NAD(P)H-hydrate epimerase [Formosa agariphila]CDF79123.1 YjeF-like protein [Formosa agariphila KMM 3901]